MGIMIKTIFSIIALTLTLIILTTIGPPENPPPPPPTTPSPPASPKRPTSRFLQQNADKPRNPRAADHCNKDNDICGLILTNSRNATCCNNKCVDLGDNNDNCGACKKKCDFTETCCRGECVNLAYDKRHCGSCNRRCMPGGFCIYGLCDYA